MTGPEVNVPAVRVRNDDGEWWLNAEDLVTYFREVSEHGVRYAMELGETDEMNGFANYAVARSIGRLADAMDVSLIAAATQCEEEGHPHTVVDLG